jgi:hypothetical protein
MKKLAILTGCLLVSAMAVAQGTVNFANAAAGLNAPVSNAAGDPCEGTGYWAQLYAVVDSSLTAVGDPVNFRTGGLAGVFLGGARTIPGVAAGADATVQVRAWSANFSSWDAAWAAFGSGDASAETGWSNSNTGMDNLDSATFTVTTGGGTLPAGNLLNLTSFQLAAVPEPSTIALGILAGLALLIRRRK